MNMPPELNIKDMQQDQKSKASFKDTFHKTLDEKVFTPEWEDGAFMDDVRQATLRGAHPAANLLFWTMALFVIVFIVWAALAEIDEVTSGQGQVIPSGRAQKLQSLEGGIVEEILVREGQVVDANQILVRIDDTGFAASLGERRKREQTLQAAVARLEAELNGKKPKFPETLKTDGVDVIAAALEQYRTRMQERKSAIGVYERQVEQRRQEIREAQKRMEQTQRSWELANQEYQMAIPLERDGVISQVELLRLEREVNELYGDKETAKLSVPKARSALQETQSRLQEVKSKLDSDTQAQLADAKDELEQLNERLKADTDRVDRTALRSPVRAEVKQLFVNTIGGVIQPGQDVVELVPLDETLLVEAYIRPQDIAFVRPGQPAKVKLTAYDPTVYGSLQAELVQISPDTISNENGDAFYKIIVRTQTNTLDAAGEPLPIISGMVATVDILTGHKTVLDYLLKPLRKARERALRER